MQTHMTSKASLSKATNAMDDHSNVSSVIPDVELYVVVISEYIDFVRNKRKNAHVSGNPCGTRNLSLIVLLRIHQVFSLEECHPIINIVNFDIILWNTMNKIS